MDRPGKILVTGCRGQFGSEALARYEKLRGALREEYRVADPARQQEIEKTLAGAGS